MNLSSLNIYPHMTKEQKIFSVSILVFGTCMMLEMFLDLVSLQWDHDFVSVNSLSKVMLSSLKEGIILSFSVFWVTTNFTLHPRPLLWGILLITMFSFFYAVGKIWYYSWVGVIAETRSFE